MSQNSSDYKLDRANVYDMLPQVNKNPLTKALAETTFNRFYTKPELQRVIGTIGLASSATKDQIAEADVYDQAFQLQPVIKNTASTEPTITTYKDIKRACEMLGIDLDRVEDWQKAERFNYSLPINLDKLINFNEYYWVGSGTPQYITIENIHIKLQAQLSQMVSHYLEVGSDKATVWSAIKGQLDIIQAAIPNEDDRLTIKGLDEVLNDAIHAPYVASAISNVDDYAIGSDWSIDNKWVHRADVADLSLAKQAKMPIIEYNRTVELTEWTTTKVNWKYRKSAGFPWIDTDAQPSRNELLTRYSIVAANEANNTFSVSGNRTTTFVPGFNFTVEGSTVHGNVWEVTSSIFNAVANHTVIGVSGNIISNAAQGSIVPLVKTSLGDDWRGLHEHWMVHSIDTAAPCLAPTALSIRHDDRTQIVATAGQTLFQLSGAQITGTNVLRVYVNGIRQYGTYAEEPSNKVRFHTPLNVGDVVDLYPYAMALEDQSKELVQVRTSEDDSAPLENVCLVKYRLQEQYKTKSNQYPLFTLVTTDGTSAFESSNIFQFAEDSSAAVNSIIGKRIVYDAKTRDYTYKVNIVADDGTLKYYRDKQPGKAARSLSVWRRDMVADVSNDYVPQQVNKNRKVADPAIEDTAYEIPKQLTENVHHECRNILKSSELFLHLKSIIDNQAPVNATVYGTQLNKSNSYRVNDDINYGAGGTIKEYNYSFDNFISSLVSTDHSVISILNFAETQYLQMLVKVREFIERNIVNAITSANTSTSDIKNYLIDAFISSNSKDANMVRVYGDSSVSITSDLKNWVATLPYVRLAKAVKPEILSDAKLGVYELIHHDGHSSVEELNDTTNEVAQKGIIQTFNLYPNNVQQTKPSTSLSAGMLWYNSINDTIYRLNVVSVGATTPSASYSNGSYWYNPQTDTVYVKQGPWTVTSMDLDALWTPLSLRDLTVEIIQELEQKLYDSAPVSGMRTDYAPTIDLTSEYKNLMQLEYETYCNVNGILSPYQGDYDATNAFTWNYKSVLGIARWYDIYQEMYGTAYPHLQPWKLQGYDDKPTWWDNSYKSAVTTRRWKSVMWTNIRTGVVPSGRKLPTGGTSTGVANEVIPVQKTSVNITNSTTYDGIGPDDLFPPYWVDPVGTGFTDHVLLSPAIGSAEDINIITSTTNNTYSFSANGPKERAWKQSINYQYAKLRTHFKLDPVRFMHYAFGEEFAEVDGLRVSTRLNKVLSHRDIVFHGDIDASGEVQYYEGLNQLYIQFFRYNALDLNGSDFKRAWNSWTTQLAYDIGSFIVNNTLSVSSPLFEITPNDYTVEMKVARQVSDLWVDALFINVQQAGSRRELPLGAARDWKFAVSTRCPIAREYSYYGVKKFRTVVDFATNTFDLLEGSLSLAEWHLGDAVVFDLGINGILPGDIDNITYYFIIPISDTKFMVANSKENAIAGINITFDVDGAGTYYIAELQSTFNAFESKNSHILWKHFALNKNDVRKFNSGVAITGIQNVVDLVDGYSAYLVDQGVLFNDSSVQEYDETNNRMLNWQYEIENFIDTMYAFTNSNAMTTNSTVFRVGTIELNPFKNNLWLVNPTGIVSEFNAVDVKDAQSQAIVYDRFGKKINNRHFNVLRQDAITHIASVDQSFDTTQTIDFAPMRTSEYSFGGMHAFFNEYEHVLVFNSYTIANQLVYDSFLGISIPRVQAYFEKQTGTTKRPNVGGFVMQDGKLKQNYEYTVANILKYYDTFTVNENADFVNYARALLGYSPNASYMTSTNVTPKSQFLFYKGMIKAKGTTGSVNAFTNSRHFSSSTLDEFWAYRAFDFGDSRTKIAYSINLYPEDTVRNHAKFEFTPDDNYNVDQFFTRIALTDTTRWSEFPSQAPTLEVTSSLMELHATSDTLKTVRDVVIQGDPAKVVYHAEADSVMLYRLPSGQKITSLAGNGVVAINPTYITDAGALEVYLNGVLLVSGTDYLETSATTITLQTTFIASDVVVIIRKAATLKEGIHYVRLNSRTVKMLITIGSVRVVTYAPNYKVFTPIKIYDHKSEAAVKDIMPWDPAQGFHQAKLVQHVDRFSSTDPALYNNALVSYQAANGFWSYDAVDSTWVDTSSFEYLPYNDLTLDTNAKLVQWGKLAEWSDAAVYVWVKSSLSPRNRITAVNAGTETGLPYACVYKRSRNQYTATANFTTGVWTLDRPHDFVVGDEVVVTAEDTLPTPLMTGIMYMVAEATSNTLVLTDRDGSFIPLVDDGVGAITINKAYYSSAWELVQRVVVHHEATEIDFTSKTLSSGLSENEEYSLYVNGLFAQDGGVTSNGIIVLEDSTIDLVSSNPEKHTLTAMTKVGSMDGTSSVRPNDLDLTGSYEQQYVDYPSTRIDTINPNTNAVEPTYYYWVRGKQDPINATTTLTTNALERLLHTNDDAYLLGQKPHGSLNDGFAQLIISGVAGTVSEAKRYTLRMIKDHTLRNDVADINGKILKPVHSEWVMFREKQEFHIDRSLWNMVTESILGFSLADPLVPVPSLDRVVYDNVNGTLTRYGMDRGQTFVPGDQALETILLILNNPEIDYDSIDVDYFLDTHDTSTSEGILKFMTDIYDTFPAIHVNRLFFAVMMDALANTGVDYSSNLMKTSAISISGTSPLNVNGDFDE